MTENRIVDNRTLLLGLTELYRAAMKRQEAGKLLHCARRVAAALALEPAAAPVEGYYTEEPDLSEYFLLMRVLQSVSAARAPAVESLPEFKRLRQVAGAPLYGKPTHNESLLPAGTDALSQALLDAWPNWNSLRLLEAANNAAERMDDFSLVGLAARIKDAVVLTAARESVVLYAAVAAGAAARREPPKYVWQVDAPLAAQARRFVEAFNALFDDKLPLPEASQAETYWRACARSDMAGRCVRLGYNDATPPQHYHWAIHRKSDGTLAVHEFWSPEVWTTERFSAPRSHDGQHPEL